MKKEKETLADKRIILPRMGRLENYENQDIIMCYGKDVKEKIQNVQRRLKEEIVGLKEQESGYYDGCNDDDFIEVINKIFNEEIGNGLL